MSILKSFNDKTWQVLQRAFLRSLVLGILLLTATGILDTLIDLARFHGSSVPDRYPEILIIFRAVAILTWLELSIFWIRMSTQPGVDIQSAAKKAMQDPIGAAHIYWASKFTWVVRMVILLQLCDFLK